ncbi:pyridoxal-dependent decarboxylase, exosortase A system-associated [Pelagibius sp.]|uniref:pyridoxal-dependent decarboxylase, exosortase A system-associated n=1 Tax=Pelagibius sp. TaxID=1931238 RepID=UPI00262EADAF|nr:pyridoxal-dependent decarboxylase, exosortase A system-associated [Pelagibius sp.]
MTERDDHPALKGWQSREGELLVGNVPITSLARRVGRTPFFAYDRARLKTRIAELRAELPERLTLHYAIKANPMAALVCFLAERVDGFDVASAGELTKALDAGMAPSKIGFAGPGKTDQELTQALAAGVLVEVESGGELARLSGLAADIGATPRIALRINPDFQLKGSGMRMGGGAQQFGIDAEDAPQIIADGRARGLEIQGFHIFAGSQNLNAETIAEVQTKTLDLALRLADLLASPMRYLNLGGGFGIPYFPKDRPLDLARVGESLATVVDTLAEAQPQARPVLELGRYIVGEAGLYVTRVIDRKVSRGEVFLVTDGGLHHHLAASGNFGQVIRRNFPLVIANRMGAAPQERASVVGCLCTPLDLLADKASLPRAEVGDLVAIFQSGAYGLTASPTAFLGHPDPAEVLV